MGGDSTAFETVLDLCRHQQRRIVLAVLDNEQRSLTRNDLTRSILKYNHQVPVTEASDEVRTEIQMMLHHVHIPKLQSSGVIEYDTERQLVTPTNQFDQMQPIIAAIIDADSSIEAPLTL